MESILSVSAFADEPARSELDRLFLIRNLTLEKRLEELLLAKRPEPKYSISQVVEKAKELGISYGNCSLLLRLEKITI